MNKRNTLGKRLRFSIFNRDGFACQYCGRTPDMDNVLLHVDHVISIKDGGTDDRENLLTSCRDCNLGKSATSVLRRRKNEKDIEQELIETKERLEQLKELTKGRAKIQQTKNKITALESEEILAESDRNYTERVLVLLNKARKEIGNDKIFYSSLGITQNKFLVGDICSPSVFLNYLKGVARNLNLPKEHSEILREYNNQIYKAERMDRRVREFILNHADIGIESHLEVISLIHKFCKEKHGECYKLRDGLDSIFKKTHLTIYKSGINLQLLVCDTILLKLEEYE